MDNNKENPSDYDDEITAGKNFKLPIQPNQQNSVEQISAQQKRTRTDFEEDKSEDKDSSQKRPRKSLQQAEGSKGRKRSQNVESDLGDGEVKKAYGLEKVLHGIVYQLKVLMLFLKRGLMYKYEFALGTEVPEAEGFDDVVFRYIDPDKDTSLPLIKRYTYRFLQAKHKQDVSIKITIKDLLQEQGKKPDDFSLKKYFTYYRKIKQDPKFKGCELKDFVICTNIGLEEKLRNDSFETVEGEDNILMFDGNFERLKLNVDKFPYKENLFSILKKDSECNSLATRKKRKVLPNDDINDKEIEDFFKKLVFAVNTPNESDLGDIIKAEINEDFDLIDAGDLRESELQKYILDFMKKKKNKFLTYKEGKEFYEKTKQKISNLVLTGLAIDYRIKNKEFGIIFKDFNFVELTEFLDPDRLSIEIFNLISPLKTISSIKVCQALADGGFSNDGTYIFIRLSTLLHMKEHVINAFKLRNLLVIDIDCEAGEKNVDELYDQLSKILLQHNEKKIILITQANDSLADKFKHNKEIRYEEIEDVINGLTDLTDKSQTKLLENKIKFQGEEVCLNKLIDQESKHIIDAEVLYRLIKKQGIKIGSKVPQKSDHLSPAYNIIMLEEIKIERFKDEDVEDDLFVISGVEEETLINLGITKEKICLFDKCDFNDQNPKQFILLKNKKTIEDHEKNIEDFETVCHNYSDKTIFLIDFQSKKLLRYYDPKFYTDREFYQIEIAVDELRKHAINVDKKDIKEIIAVSGITKEEFVKKYKIDTRLIDNSNGRGPIILNTDFDRLRCDDELKDFNIHWLENKESKLFWKDSKGETSALSKLRVSKPDVTHNCLLDIVKGTRSTLIADLSGMGKSTTLTHLINCYKKENGLHWVIRVSLKDYSSEIDKLPDEYNFENVVDFFSAIDRNGLEDTFAKKLFQHRLEKEKKILLLFDGFDEISSSLKGDIVQSADRHKKVTTLLKFLKYKTRARTVVTTRPYEKEKTSLENELSVLSYTFKPIEIEREQFLKSFWKISLRLKYTKNEIEESKYEEFAQKLISKFNEAVNRSGFLDIPLHMRMLAEVYLEKFENFCKDLIDLKDLNIFDLYKEFVNRKYDIYLSEKTSHSSAGGTNFDLDALRERYEKYHKHLSFKYLFSGSVERFFLVESLFNENEMPNERITDLNKIGIFQSKTKANIDFIHRTFAEYFVSKLIYGWLKQNLNKPKYAQELKNEMRTFLLNFIFIEEDKNIIRSFINSKLADKSDNLENFWSGPIDPLKDQLLLAVKEGLGNIFSFLLHSRNDERINEELLSVPRMHIEKLYNDGEYIEASLYGDNALKFLKELKLEEHLEMAKMKRYHGNALGTTIAENTKNKEEKRKLFKKREALLTEALKTYYKHLKVAKGDAEPAQDDYLRQAVLTFKDDLKSIKANKKIAVKSLDKNEKKMWIQVLEIEIAETNRNLANTFGDLGFYEKKMEILKCQVLPTFEEYLKDAEIKEYKKLLLKVGETKRNLGNASGKLLNHDHKKVPYLKEALRIFEELFDKKKYYLEEDLNIRVELRIGETKRNLGDAYGKLYNKWDKGRRLLEEALPVLKKNYGLFHENVTKAQENLCEAYKNLGYPLHGAVFSGNRVEVEKELKENNSDNKTDDWVLPPLHLAVREGHKDIVKLLLEKQSQFDIKTALDLAKKQLNQNPQIYREIVDILELYINKQQDNPSVNQANKGLSEECSPSTIQNTGN